MIPVASLYTSNIPCGTSKVRTADGILLTVAGIETINLEAIGKECFTYPSSSLVYNPLKKSHAFSYDQPMRIDNLLH